MDASADKKISQDEFLAAVRKTFAALDQDKDGRISSAEAKPYLSRNTSY
jgi:hypothetical protein